MVDRSGDGSGPLDLLDSHDSEDPTSGGDTGNPTAPGVSPLEYTYYWIKSIQWGQEEVRTVTQVAILLVLIVIAMKL